MSSVVIAAHNEEATIGRCLDALFAPGSPEGLDVTVVANGCTDATAARAAGYPGVRVLDLPEPGKAGALNAGDAAAVGYPRIYLDADIVLPPGALAAIVATLEQPGPDGTVPLAVVPRRRLDVSGRPGLVRAFYAINSRLPVYRDALFGRGVIALSEAGRARFETFPDIVADDLFLDSLFASGEKRQAEGAVSVVATPRRTADLVRRLARVRSGNAALRGAARDGQAPTGVRASRRSSWLRDVVLPRPWLAPAGVCYAAIILSAEVAAKRAARDGVRWGRDESSRRDDA